MRYVSCLLAVFSLLPASRFVFAEDTGSLPSVAQVAKQIDQQVQRKLDEEKLAPAALATDLILLRRISLDLLGRVPTLNEVNVFKELPADSRYEDWVSKLAESPEFSHHLRDELDVLLLARRKDDSRWREYLLWATDQNRSWDQIFQDIMLPNGQDEPAKYAAEFLLDRVREADQMTNDTATSFFGVNISCAQCHDHPLVSDWEQKHFFGMMSFFNRTYRTKKGQLAEKFSGSVKYKDVLGKEYDAPFMFLSGAEVEEPQVEKSEEERKKEEEIVKEQMQKDDAPAPPMPDFSPRAKLVSLALKSNDEGQNFLARSMVNRTWARLMGRGLVEPLDQMHSENPASHPELLDLLSRDFIASGYDLRRLVQEIVLSTPYRRSTEWTSASECPPPEAFGVGQFRPLSRRQLAVSLSVVAANPEKLTPPEAAEDAAKRRDSWERSADGLVRVLEIPEKNFQVSVDEALYFSNNNRVQNDLLRDSGDKLVGYLQTLEPTQATAQAFLICLTREPTDDEQQYFEKYLSEHNEQKNGALQNVVWSLITSPEFRFNH